jgi:hypothetical protein
VRSLERLLQGLGIAPPSSDGSRRDAAGELRIARPEPKKFDLGPGIDRGPVREHIPWGYGTDRITAMPVDPDRLYVYWELTDEAIAAARRDLGAGGESAWPSLRVYDVTGRIFDGTNAHAYFDHRVEREDRQWFFSLGRPGSTVCVDVGMKSVEGYFVRIARSGRADLPRSWAAPPAPVEWMTVRAESGEITDAHRADAMPAALGAGAQQVSPATAGDARDAGNGHAPGATDGHGDGDRAERATARNGWLAGAPGATHEIRRRSAWVGDVERTTWQAGPFANAVTPPVHEVIERRSGESRTVETPQGRLLLEQPWSVTIRGIGAHVTRRVIGRWHIVRVIPSASGAEQIERGPVSEAIVVGGSEALLPRGASEQRIGASDLHLGGASEEFFVGASELRFGGASERLLVGASETLWSGASERMWQGASELLYVGASERIAHGASEERLAGSAPGWRASGASEQHSGCASEQRFGGASEQHFGGASAQRLGGASESIAGAPGPNERSARASWQAFVDAGTRLASSHVEPHDVGDATFVGSGASDAPRNSDGSSDDDAQGASVRRALARTAPE